MTSRRIRKSPLALADINQISDWLLERSGSVEVVLKWLADLDERFVRIASAPGTGTARPELGTGVRRWAIT